MARWHTCYALCILPMLRALLVAREKTNAMEKWSGRAVNWITCAGKNERSFLGKKIVVLIIETRPAKNKHGHIEKDGVASMRRKASKIAL